MNIKSGFSQIFSLIAVGAFATGLVYLSQNVSKFSGNIQGNAQVLAEATVELSVKESSHIANQDGSQMTVGGDKAWIGNAQSTSQSMLGLRFTGASIPAGAQIQSAHVDFVAVGGWIKVSTQFLGDTSGKGSFSKSELLTSRSVTGTSASYSDDVRWEAASTYSYNVTEPVKTIVGTSGATSINLLVKGTGSQWGRKEIVANIGSGKAPKLRISYLTSTSSTSPSATPIATGGGIFTTSSPSATASPTTTATARPTATATPVTTVPPTASPVATGTSSIYGAVSTDILGTCSATVHDRYIVKGPNGTTYRTWHPQAAPIEANNPNGSKCSFAHEHGDDPSVSNIFAGAVPFNYVPSLISMDEPHAGFKCFVHNKGLRNDEGGVALHDSYYCFHMGTGGPARFTARFHSMEFHMRSSTGARMDVVGLADTGNVGTICDSPRQSRTVMGLGCKIDSAYEIWENSLRIVNKGNTVATAITSTAAFDSISVMDPADKTKVIYIWDPLAQSGIFKFNDPRQNSRGCDREAYSGPVSWYNRGGTQVYYTDVYGNVVNGGAVKQVISTSNTTDAGTLTQFGGLIMAYKGGNDPQVQFKYRKSSCAPGLGLKN